MIARYLSTFLFLYRKT